MTTDTLTFLFTDIEGSTPLLERIGHDDYVRLLAEHHSLIRSCLADRGGREVDTQGDGFFAVFTSPRAALASVIEMQTALAEHRWPGAEPVRVRTGLHAGEAEQTDTGVVGLELHRAARVAALAHGGQILLSEAAAVLMRGSLPAGVKIRYLGEYRLKGFEDSERIFQVDAPGLQVEFPPLASTDDKPPQRRRSAWLIVAGAVLVGAAIALVAVRLADSSSGPVRVEQNSVAAIDPRTNTIASDVLVGISPGPITFDSGSLWVANVDDQNVWRVDPASQRLLQTFSLTGAPTGVAATPGGIWVVQSSPQTKPSGVPLGSEVLSLNSIDPQYDTVGPTQRFPKVTPGGSGEVAAQGDQLWVAVSAELLARLDPLTGQAVKWVNLHLPREVCLAFAQCMPAQPSAIAIGAGALWVADSVNDNVTRIDPTGVQTPIAVGHTPNAIAVGADAVWVTDAGDGTLVRIDPATNAVVTTIPVGTSPTDVAIGFNSVWVVNNLNGTVTRVDPTTNKVTATITVGQSPQAITLADGRAWVTIDAPAVSPP